MKLIIFLLLTFAVIFYSCGSDTVTNITNPPSVIDSLIYTKDSLIAYSDSVGSSLVNYEIDSLTPAKYRISFTSSTDDTSHLSNVEVTLVNQDSTQIYFDEGYFG